MPSPMRERHAVGLWLDHLRRTPLLLFLILYTVVTGGPFLWVASMSLRTTPEIFDSPYALPSPAHWGKFADAWTVSNYGTYFWNSLIVVGERRGAADASSARWPRIAWPATASAAAASCGLPFSAA